MIVKIVDWSFSYMCVTVPSGISDLKNSLCCSNVLLSIEYSYFWESIFLCFFFLFLICLLTKQPCTCDASLRSCTYGEDFCTSNS